MTQANKNEVFIVSYSRTPIGSFRGQLNKLTASDLGSVSIKSAIEKAGITSDDVDEVFMGHVLSAGCGQTPARQAALKAGLPHRVPCTGINKVCASGAKSIIFAAQSIMLEQNDVVIAGGMESMSNTPFIIPRGEIPYGGLKLTDTLVFDGLTDSFNNLHMGNCAELLTKKFNISREDQDEYAKLSYSRGQKATADGIFSKEIVPVTVPGRRGEAGLVIDKDEELAKADFSKFSTLRPVFGETITAANASSLNDGGAALVLMSSKALAKYGCKPLAKIVSYADASLDPIDFGIAPSLAIPKALERAGLNKEQIARFEINEAFSVVALANMKSLSIDRSTVNIHGGAVGLGHPLGMSGTRIVGTMAVNMQPGEYGLASACNGGGGASAILIQRV